MSYNLFLDDIRLPEGAAQYMPWSTKAKYRTEDWTIVRNYEEFVEAITKNGLPSFISFDRDLVCANCHRERTFTRKCPVV